MGLSGRGGRSAFEGSHGEAGARGVRMKTEDCRRDVTGDEKVRNSSVGETRSVGVGVVFVAVVGSGDPPPVDDDAAAAAAAWGVVGIRVPLRLAKAFGSIDLRRRCPPRGSVEVSMLYGDSGSQAFSFSQL
jgi:hypothetical protein